MSKEDESSPTKFALTCDTCHGNQVIRGLLWCENELEAAVCIKKSCHQFATVKNIHGITALHVAAAKGWNKMCRWLLRNGADVEARVKMRSRTPVQLAAMFGNVDTIMLLTKAGSSSGGTSAPSHGIFKYLYSNINFGMRSENFQLADAYEHLFAAFLKHAGLEDSIERVDFITPMRRIASRHTPTTLSQRQLQQKFLSYIVQTEDERADDLWQEDNDEEIREMAEICEARQKKFDKINDGSSVYVFGINQNYNLGLGTDDRRDRPTQLERLTRELSVAQACLTKYHSLYLTVSGTVLACGHGVGGRLGVGTEDTCVRPEQVKLPSGTKVVMVAAGADHSLFLTSAGEVYACGLNTHYQLGLSTQASDKFVTPKKIAVNLIQASRREPLSRVVGVACGDWHSVLWTKTHLYTWGTNVGQLGHSDPVVHVPRPVTCCSAFAKSSGIYKVCTNNVCTVAATRDGIVVALLYNKYSVITSTFGRDENIVESLSCFGGNYSKLKTLFLPSANGPSPFNHETENLWDISKEPSEIISGLVEKKHPWDNVQSNMFKDFQFDTDDLVVIMVTTGNNAFVWSDKYRFLRSLSRLSSLGSKEMQPLISIIPTPSDVLAVTDIGEVLKLKLFVNSHSRKQLNYRSYSLTHLHRARKVFSDPRGQNFAVLTHGAFPKHEIKHMGWKSLTNDMESLYKNASNDESLCDVVLLCEGKRLPAHKMVLAAKSLYFRELFSASTDEETSSKKDCRDERVQKNAPKTICECCFSPCSKAFQALFGISTSNSVDQVNNEQNLVGGQRVPEGSVELSSSFKGGFDASVDFEDPTLPTVDVSFIAVDVLQEILHFCYTGMCKQIKYPDFYLNSMNFHGHILRFNYSGPADAPCLSVTHPLQVSDYKPALHFDPSGENFQPSVGLDKFIASLVRGVQALKIQDFMENCELHPDPRLHQSLGTGLDVQFEAPDRTLGPKAHRFMLSARVPFFNALFSARWSKKSYSAEGLQLVRSPHCHSPAFFLLLQFCYTGSFCCCGLTLPLLQDVIVLADELLVTEARTLAEKHAVEFIDRRNLMSLYHFSVNFGCLLLRQHILFYAFFDTPFMLESRLMENLRAEDMLQISLMHKQMGGSKMNSSNCFPVHGVILRTCSPTYFLPTESGGSDSKSTSFSVSYVRRVHTQNQMLALALCETLSIGDNDFIEEDPMVCLRSLHPELYLQLMKHSEDTMVELESEDFMPPEEVELPNCPFTYHFHSLPRSWSNSYLYESDTRASQWPEGPSGVCQSAWRRGDFPPFTFDDLVDRVRIPSGEEDENPWHVVGRRYDIPSAKSLSKGSDSIPRGSDVLVLDDPQSANRSRTNNAAPDDSKRKSSNVGNASTSSGTTRRKTKRANSNNVGGPSGASASNCDKRSTADKQSTDDSKASEVGAKAFSEPSPGPLNDEGTGPGRPATSTSEATITLSSEFPSLAESVKAAAQQQLLAAKSSVTKMTPPFVRTSQKQRKKQMREQQEAEAAAVSAASEAAAVPVTPKAPTPAWGLASSSPAPAEHQQEFEFPSLSSGRVRRTSQRTLSSSSGGSDFGVGSPQSASNFSAIMQREKAMKENYEKSQRKSLEHIQMEERAITELEQYYRALAGDADTITVSRYSAPQSLPLWTEKHRPRDML